MVERFSSIAEIRQAVGEAGRDGRVVGFVPTMGALHAGHLSLVRAARARSDAVVVSVFVNPTQFVPGEDFQAYPRDLERDLGLLGAEGVEYVFTPSVAEMYPPGATVQVDPGPLATGLCGASRPGLFRGVVTVVAKLFNVVRPDLAFFGEKDYQQLVVVRAIARDLDYALDVVGCPTVRERDGLAMSSRNAYLAPAEREAATVLFRALNVAREAADAGERSGVALAALMERVIEDEPLVRLEYAAVVDPDSLERLVTVGRRARALVAAAVGQTRLIDNLALVD